MPTNHSEKFFFISYSQKNLAVGEDLKKLDDLYANYWIDRDGMRATDDTWIERARTAIFDKNCKGALFYICLDSLSSEAVENEMSLVLERKKENSEFFLIAVLVGGRSIHELIRNVYVRAGDADLRKILPLSRIARISKLFPDEKIPIIRTGDALESYYEVLYKNLFECGVIINTEAIMNQLNSENKLDEYGRYTFGTFYGAASVTNVLLLNTNVFEERRGVRYIKLDDGSVRIAEEIKWMILDYYDGKMKMISEAVLDQIPGNSIERWLNDFFYKIAFTDAEKSRIVGSIGTLSYEEYEKYNGNGGINPTEGKFWLSSVNIRNQQNKLMYVSGANVDKLGLRKDSKYGIRPVVEIMM